MINLIAQALIVMASSWLFTKKYFDRRLLSELILVWFILFFSQIVLVELFWGIIGQLYFWNVFLTQGVILILALLICYNKNAFCFPKPDADFFVNNNLLLFAFSVFLAFFLVKAYVNLINPPVSPGSMQQHLAFPATWIVNGNLNNPFHIFQSMPFLHPTSLETSSASYYPINAQLFYTWLMMPLRNAFLADAGEAPFYIIGIIAIYAILRKFNLNRPMALLSGFLWALIPNLFKQLRIGSEIDVICAVLFLLVFYALLLLKEKFSLSNALLFGISAGIFAGTKVINFVWLAAFMPFICYTLYKVVKTGKFSRGTVLILLSIATLMVVLFGGFIYIKNYMFTGNPLFPYNLKILGGTVFMGLIDNTAYKTQVACWRLDINQVLFKEGLGVQFLALILPGTFIPLVFYRHLRNKFKPLGEYLLLFTTPLIMLILYAVSINIYTMRYFFPYLSLGLLTAVIFISKSARGNIGNIYFTCIAFISIVTAAFKLANGYELVVSVLLALTLFIALVIYKKQVAAFYKSKVFGKVVLLALLPVFLLFIFLNNKYDREEFSRYPLNFSKKEAWQRDLGKGWQAFNDLTKEGARVAHTGRQEFYPLFGSKLKNYVTYISVNEKEATPYNKPDGFYRKVRNFNAWRENLQKQRIEYLFITLPCLVNRESEDPAKFSIEDEWANAHPGDFKLLFGNSLSRIYKVSIEK